MFQDLAASFLVVLVIVGVPVLAWQTAHNQEIRTLPRTALYLSAALSEWILAALAVGVVLVAGPRLREERDERGIVHVPVVAVLHFRNAVPVEDSAAGLAPVAIPRRRTA